MSTDKDMFIINKIFPNAKDIFTISGKPISEIKNDCLFVFDTNSLIIPYTTSSQSLDEIKRVYTKIIQENRLFIPGQVAREFARTRPDKIKEVFQQLTRNRSKIQQLSIGKYPLLSGLKEYDELFVKQEEINAKLKEYTKQLGSIIDHVKGWFWNDPVSSLYTSLFKDDVVVDLEFDESKLKTDLDYRYEKKIAPGYEDRSKGDGGIGDLLIWYTILDLAEKHKKSIIFVSGDKKKDWFYQTENQALYPKFELITEFRSKAPGELFSIIKLSEFLELFDASEEVVEEVESEENYININYFYSTREENYVSHIHDWIIKNITGFNVLTHESGFPEILLVENTGVRKIAAEIVIWREISPFLMSLNYSLQKFIPMAVENNYNKLIIFVIVKPMLIMPSVIDEIKNLLQNFESDELEIEIILGRIVESNFVVTVVI